MKNKNITKNNEILVIKLFILIISLIIYIFNVLAADPGHAASRISAGTFEGGDYYFPAGIYTNLTSCSVSVTATGLLVCGTGGSLTNVAFINESNTFQAGLSQTFDTNTLFIDASSHSIGIGTISPTQKLEIVNGNFLINNTVFFVNGTSGNVGINTTTPAEKLEVTGNIKLSGASPTYKITNVATPTATSDAATKGSADAAGANYVTVSKSQKFTANGTFTVPNNVTLLWVTASGGGGGGGGGNIIGLSNDLTPQMTSATDPSPNVVEHKSAPVGGYEGWRAFDHIGGGASGENSWFSTSAPSPAASQWIKFDFGSGNAHIFSKVGIQAPYATWVTRAPRNFTILGSNDNSIWTLLLTATGQTSWTDNEVRAFSFTNSNLYRYLQINVSADNGGLLAGIAEVYIYKNSSNGAGGGGGGEIKYHIPVTVTPGQVINVTIGSSGNGGTVNTNGTSGGNTTFGNDTSIYIIAMGGNGGKVGNSSLGGAGGKGGGVLGFFGAGGAGGSTSYGNGTMGTNTIFNIGGAGGGGGSSSGSGGIGASAPCFNSYAGGAGSIYAGGGGGGGGAGINGGGGAGTNTNTANNANNNSGAGGGGGSMDSGGNGGSGLLIVEWIAT